MTKEEIEASIAQSRKNIEEFKEYCREQLPILRLQEKAFDVSTIKTLEDFRKYWRLREKIIIFEDTISESKYYPAEWYKKAMEFAVESLTHAKTISEEIWARCYDKHCCMEMDFVGEARCAVGTPHHPPYFYPVGEEEKKIWQEVVELGSKFHDLRPENMDDWRKKIFQYE